MARRHRNATATAPAPYGGVSPADVEEAQNVVNDQIGFGTVPYEQIYPNDPAPTDNTDYGDQGGYDSAPARVPYDPYSDPSFQALIASYGLRADQARAAAAQRIGDLQTEGIIQAPRIQEAGIEQRRGISGNAEGRGLFQSGERLRNLSLQRRGEDQRLADLQRATARGVASTNQSLSQQLADIANQRAQSEFQARLAAGSA